MKQCWIKTIRALYVIATASLATACQYDFKDYDYGNDPLKVGLYAGGVHTRTSMLPDGLSAEWSDGDEIAVWALNNAGTYVLSNQVFKTYGIDKGCGFFTSTLASPMPEDVYTYMCCYPVPMSMNGTRATFKLSANQDGKASSGADIMVADPVTHGPLVSIADPDDNGRMSLRMNRLMHQFRFWIPEGANVLNEDIKKIEVTMPDNIVGNVITDIADHDGYFQLAGGSKTVILDLDEPIGESEYDGTDYDEADFACAVVFPHEDAYSATDFMNVTVYTNSGKSVLDPIPLAGRSFLAGHSTPVRLIPKSIVEYCKLTVKVGRNYIGEPLWNIRITSGGKTLFSYANTAGTYENIVYDHEYTGAEGKASYDAVVNAIAAGNAVLNFETNHASVDIPMTADMMVRDGNSAVLNLGDVPYLLYEDFSSARPFATKEDSYTGSGAQPNGLTGYLLNDYLSTSGWSSARFQIIEDDCIRINCLYECASIFGKYRYCGRLDTPALKYLKQGTSVNVVVEFDKAVYVPKGYNVDHVNEAHAFFHLGYHSNSENQALNGVMSDKISSNATIVKKFGPFANENIGDMQHVSETINSAGPSTRIVFYMDTDCDVFKTFGANSCYYLYLDNIKVYIKN